MFYPFKYNFSASSGFFHFTISGSPAYFQYDTVNLNKPAVLFRKQPEKPEIYV
jgi:hypothetical protein